MSESYSVSHSIVHGSSVFLGEMIGDMFSEGVIVRQSHCRYVHDEIMFPVPVITFIRLSHVDFCFKTHFSLDCITEEIWLYTTNFLLLEMTFVVCQSVNHEVDISGRCKDCVAREKPSVNAVCKASMCSRQRQIFRSARYYKEEQAAHDYG